MLIIPPVDSVYSLSNDLQRTASKTFGLLKPSAQSRAKSYVRNMTTLMVLVDNATRTIKSYTRNTPKPTSTDLDTAVARLNDFDRHHKAITNRIAMNATTNAHVFRKKTTSAFSDPVAAWRVESKLLGNSIARYSKAVMALAEKLAMSKVGRVHRTNVPKRPTASKARPAPGRR